MFVFNDQNKKNCKFHQNIKYLINLEKITISKNQNLGGPEGGG